MPAWTWWRANHSPYLTLWSWFPDFLSHDYWQPTQATVTTKLYYKAASRLFFSIAISISSFMYSGLPGGVHSISLGYYYGKSLSQLYTLCRSVHGLIPGPSTPFSSTILVLSTPFSSILFRLLLYKLCFPWDSSVVKYVQKIRFGPSYLKLIL